MLVIIAIAGYLTVEPERCRSTSCRLSAKVCNRHVRCKKYGIAQIPNLVTEIHILVVVEKLFIEAAKTFHHIAPKQKKTAGVPIDFTVSVTLPSDIRVRQKPF